MEHLIAISIIAVVALIVSSVMGFSIGVFLELRRQRKLQKVANDNLVNLVEENRLPYTMICPTCGYADWSNLRCNTCVSHWDTGGDPAPEALKQRIMESNERREADAE